MRTESGRSVFRRLDPVAGKLEIAPEPLEVDGLSGPERLPDLVTLAKRVREIRRSSATSTSPSVTTNVSPASTRRRMARFHCSTLGE